MVGEFAENFILRDQDGVEFELFNNLQSKILLVFYPKDDTPVCTKQLLDYNLDIEKFRCKDIRIIGINSGSVNSHSNFCSKLGLNFTLLSDNNKIVSKLFNALGLFGRNKRKLVMIDTNGKILFEKTDFPLFYSNTDFIISELDKKSGEAV